MIPGATGAGINGDDAANRTGVLPKPIAGSPAAIRYVLGTTVPETWIPFLPVQRAGNVQDIAFQRAAMPLLGTPPRELVRAGVLLNEPVLPWFVNEEEVLFAGHHRDPRVPSAPAGTMDAPACGSAGAAKQAAGWAAAASASIRSTR